MAKKNGGIMYDNVFNQTGGGEAPDVNGDRLYYTYEECMAMQLKTADMGSTPNSRGSSGIMGGPAKGEPNPADL
jgi:hypothetical protein